MNILIFLAITFLSITTAAHSASIKVAPSDEKCTKTKEFHCSIQSAVNAATAKDSILIPSGRYLENINIDKHITLIGRLSPPTIIDGSQNGSVITINPGSRVTIKNIQITNGKAENGGGILNNGSLMLTKCQVTHNIATLSGGGIFNARSITGSLFISGSKITHNKSLGDDKYNVKYGGGGIFNNSPLNISKSTISNNSAADNGGGIYSIYSGRKNPTSSEKIAEEIGLSAAPKRMNTLTRRSDSGSVSIHKSNINNNNAGSGGGINLQGVMDIKKTTIDNNKAINHKHSSGGGIFAHLDTTLNITNSTISHNEAVFRGGGIRFYSSKTGSLNNVSIIRNKLTKKNGQGAGLYLENYTNQFKIQNSLISENTIRNTIDSDCHGSINSTGYNFVGITNRCSWKENEGNIIGKEKKLDSGIKWNEKQNRYFLTKNSPLINKGSITSCTNGSKKDLPLKKDQFNKLRKDNRCDIGAVEF